MFNLSLIPSNHLLMLQSSYALEKQHHFTQQSLARYTTRHSRKKKHCAMGRNPPNPTENGPKPFVPPKTVSPPASAGLRSAVIPALAPAEDHQSQPSHDVLYRHMAHEHPTLGLGVPAEPGASAAGECGVGARRGWRLGGFG